MEPLQCNRCGKLLEEGESVCSQCDKVTPLSGDLFIIGLLVFIVGVILMVTDSSLGKWVTFLGAFILIRWKWMGRIK